MTSLRFVTLCLGSAWLVACTAFDSGLLDGGTGTGGGAGKRGSHDNGPSGGRGGSPSAKPDAGQTPELAGQGGMGGSGGAAPTNTGGAGADCRPNPDTRDEVCPQICPEVCNGQDDDCDLRVDEGAVEDLCVLEHAVATCSTKGQCAIVECTDGYRDCDQDATNGCESLLDDVTNCGSCGNRCDFSHAIAACEDGKCVVAGCDPLFADCDDNPDDCEAATNTLTRCARCDLSCSDVPNAAPSCDQGFCGVGQCVLGHGDCNNTPGDGCEETLDSLTHCGACNKLCDLTGSVDDCSGGVCVVKTCESGYDDCDADLTNGCESLTSKTNCGACGQACDASLANVVSASCSAEKCEITTCADKFGNCDSDSSNGCEADVTTLARCGACDTPCAINHAVAACNGNSCDFVRCDSGWENCNGDLSPLDGCETSLNSNATCGSCTNSCVGTALPACSGGKCSNLVCNPANTADCDGNGTSCEVDLWTDASNCGTCKFACKFAPSITPHADPALTCQTGNCKPSCDPLWGNCNSDYTDGCEQTLTTLTSCGGCGKSCSIANATESCAGGTCVALSCDPDWTDCNGGTLSCETQLGTLTNCTGCGMGCNLTNAVSSCVGSPGNHTCAVSSCSPSNFGDCNLIASDGCEIDKSSNTANCGQCGNNCASHTQVKSATCSASACNYMCNAGFGNCTSAPGCETALNTNTNCKVCGTSCARTNGTASCSTGSCALTGCNSGFDNCDAVDSNGCEPLTTLANCGMCAKPCTIPNGTGDCATQTCKVAMCNTDWADCDGVAANGCERNTKAPAMGGLGPCSPDTGCTQKSYLGRDYFFCTNDRTWADAQSRCRLQLLGDLVHVDDMLENDFVKGSIAASTWIGGSDAAVEGAWRWSDDNSQFWMGASGGTALAYRNWNMGEPNDAGGNEDCASMLTGGLWNDAPCTGLLDFVCEVQSDQCPNNTAKTSPGQCGCDILDTDTDKDGTADCNDGCINDPLKVAPGVCLCGTADTDSDGDGTPNCNDGCINDPLKIAPGACGCGVGNIDGDSKEDCQDACPYDAAHISGTCAYGYTPSNVTPGSLDFASAPDVNAACGGTITIDTGVTAAVNLCGTNATPVVQAQSGGADLWVLPLKSLLLASGTTIKFIGTRPAVLSIVGDATINGTLDVGATGSIPGAGGNLSCAAGTGQGADGVHNNSSDMGDGGGGGGGFGSAGLAGGNGNNGGGGGGAGIVAGGSTLIPLRGGCRGGSGGAGGNANGAGAGGGALQVAVGGLLTVGSTALISAAGGGGRIGASDEEGGGGGGSGGAVFLEGFALSIQANAWLTANGGAGAGGNATNTGRANPGTDGLKTNTSRAPGGSGGDGGSSVYLFITTYYHSDGGSGGDGAALGGAALPGTNASAPTCVFLGPCGGYGGGGGGGGGGTGRIRIHGIAPACSVPATRVSPAAAVACP